MKVTTATMTAPRKIDSNIASATAEGWLADVVDITASKVCREHGVRHTNWIDYAIQVAAEAASEYEDRGTLSLKGFVITRIRQRLSSAIRREKIQQRIRQLGGTR